MTTSRSSSRRPDPLGGLTVWVPGKPRPKARARHGRTKSGKPITYSDPATASYEHWIALCAGPKAPREPIDGPIRLTLTVYLQRPQKPHKRSVDYPAGRPDLDNFIKVAADGLGQAIFTDDARIVDIVARKRWAGPDGPGLLIRIEPV